MDHFPNFQGENKKYLKPPPSHLRDPSNSASFVTFWGQNVTLFTVSPTRRFVRSRLESPGSLSSQNPIGSINGIFTQQWMAKIYCKLVGAR